MSSDCGHVGSTMRLLVHFTPLKTGRRKKEGKGIQNLQEQQTYLCRLMVRNLNTSAKLHISHILLIVPADIGLYLGVAYGVSHVVGVSLEALFTENPNPR